MQVQIVYSMLSQKLHGKNPLEKSTTELYAEIHNQYMGVPYVEGTVSGNFSTVKTVLSKHAYNKIHAYWEVSFSFIPIIF